VLSELGLTAATVDQILAVPFEKIQAAAAKTASMGQGSSWGPVIDKKNLYKHPFAVGGTGPEESKDIPLLMGFNRTESTFLVGPRDPQFFSLTWETLPGKLAPQIVGVDVATVIADYRKLHPKYDASDVFFAATTDSRFVRAHVNQVELKAKQGGAPAYFYMLDWNTPVDGGRWRSPHTLEIGLVFDNVAKSESVTGVGADQQRMADLMSEAWLAFAKTGNPNNKSLPKWEPYDATQRPSMVFDLKPTAVNDVRGTERRWFDSLKMGANG
ncbi:MAG TPA: carboxylesterase family protein, partial [Steroidobacteraceae bacterium]|nr:carboxylesterase family protein [Steroidobacteraceae bacterium]